MASTISGNVGGAAASGAQVQVKDIYSDKIKFGTADASGNYSIPGLSASTHVVRAFLSAESFHHPVQVITDGVSTYSGINLKMVALNSSNAPEKAGNY